jgi:hypothetical protein
MTKYYLWNDQRYFTGSRDFPDGIKPVNGTTTAPNNEPNQKWMGNAWENVPQRQKTLDEVKLEKVNKATKFYNDIINASIADMAEFERDSWEPQRAEWLRYQDDILSQTPYCDALSTARGITKIDLMDKIGLKIVSIATVQGLLHGKLDLIKAATTIEAVNAITFE